MAPKISISTTLSLPNSKVAMPQFGFGVYQSHGPTCTQSCLTALRAGYLKIDSAQYYANESLVHDAIIQQKIPREQLWLTTKILSAGTDAESTYKSIADSVERLGGKGGYADLFLIHSASGGSKARKLMWQALERAFEEGKVRAIGVSNWGVQHFEETKEYAKVWPPHVLQIELHPWCQQREIVSYCQSHKIAIEAYCPIVRNQKAHDKTLLSIAGKHSKDPNQVLIRYSLQKGWSPLPKSDTPDRIVSNADVFDFELDEADMSALDGLDQGDRGSIVMTVKNG